MNYSSFLFLGKFWLLLFGNFESRGDLTTGYHAEDLIHGLAVDSEDKPLFKFPLGFYVQLLSFKKNTLLLIIYDIFIGKSHHVIVKQTHFGLMQFSDWIINISSGGVAFIMVTYLDVYVVIHFGIKILYVLLI